MIERKQRFLLSNDQTIIELNLDLIEHGRLSAALEAGNITSNDIDRENEFLVKLFSRI